MVKEWLIFTTTPVHFYKFDAEIDGRKIQLLQFTVTSKFFTSLK